MIDLIVLLGIAVIGAWGRYNLNLSAATATISRTLAQGTVESGLRDIITPPLLTLGYYAWFVAALAAYLGLSVFGDWSVLLFILPLLIGGACAPNRFAPGANSPYWARLVHRSLRKRHTRYLRQGKQDRAAAVLDLAGRVERAFPRCDSARRAGRYAMNLLIEGEADRQFCPDLFLRSEPMIGNQDG